MHLNEKFKPYFIFSTKEKRGVISLLLLIVIVFIVRMVYYQTHKQVASNNKLEFEYLSTEKVEHYNENNKGTKEKAKLVHKEASTNNIIINPNTSSLEELIKFGFKQRVALNIIKYREKGGIFRKAEDLKRIYGIDTSYLEKSIARIEIPEPVYSSIIDEKKKIEIVDLNKANEEDIIKLPCIGETLSKRVIKYRDILGGFYTLNQLNEVYGLDTNCLSVIGKRVFIDENVIEKISVNRANEYSLYKHPYITNYQARAIIKYRKLMGSISDITELLSSYIFNEEDFERVSKYLKI